MGTDLTAVSLDRQQLRKRVTDFCLAVQARAFTEVLAEIDSAFDKALVPPSGASAKEAEAVVRQVAVVKEAVKAPLLRRIDAYLKEDRRKADASAEYHRHRMPRPDMIPELVVAKAWDGVDTLLTSKRG
jgi:hypothetical protein